MTVQSTIDVVNYERAIAWFRQALLQMEREPRDGLDLLDIRHRMQVTYNMSEALLRRAYVAIATHDEIAQWVSGRELFRRAEDEGLNLSSRRQWLEYGLMLETLDDQFLRSANLRISDTDVALLFAYASNLEAFALVLRERFVCV